MNSIYALLDPCTNEVRYVGKTCNPQKRYLGHLSSKTKTHVSRWVQTVRRGGEHPEMVLLESGLSSSEWPEAEQFWIAYLKSLGANLTNITAGGHDVVKTPECYDDGCYTIPDFDRIQRAALNSPRARVLPPSLASLYSQLVTSASKCDRGLVCYTTRDVQSLVSSGLLVPQFVDGVKCYLVSKTDKMVMTMRESTGILCPE